MRSWVSPLDIPSFDVKRPGRPGLCQVCRAKRGYAQPTVRIFVAAGPFGPSLTSNSTFWFSFSDLKPLIWISVWWAKRSLPPASGVMKPKPFASLKNLTVPVAMYSLPYSIARAEPGPGDGHEIKGGNWAAASLPRFGGVGVDD